jgi:hypothetical protein
VKYVIKIDPPIQRMAGLLAETLTDAARQDKRKSRKANDPIKLRLAPGTLNLLGLILAALDAGAHAGADEGFDPWPVCNLIESKIYQIGGDPTLTPEEKTAAQQNYQTAWDLLAGIATAE